MNFNKVYEEKFWRNQVKSLNIYQKLWKQFSNNF